MKNIVLIGMMGCGKSTCGKLLADTLHRTFVDTDSLIEETQNRSIPDIFATEGEAFFRSLEAAAAGELSTREDLVIACGGGLPTTDTAIAPLAATGFVVFLARDPKDILAHVSMAGRPLGQAGEADFLARYARREPVYRRWANLVVSSQESPKETVNLIMEGLL